MTFVYINCPFGVSNYLSCLIVLLRLKKGTELSARMAFRTYLLVLAFIISTSLATTRKQTYIIHMDKAKMTSLDTSLLSSSKRWYEVIIDSLIESSALDINKDDEEEEASLPLLLYVYETTIFGFSARLSRNQLALLTQIDGFLIATLDEMLSLHTTHSPQFLGLNYGDGLWSLPNLASDAIIGVLDSGIWPEHISFSDNGMSPVPSHWKGTCDEGTRFGSSNCNKKLIGARAFFKANEAKAGRINETLDYRSPRDANGHGTHTASTAGGNLIKDADCLGMARGLASGMKYTARIASYKVCYTSGCSSADILAAIDQAVSDGVDVLSLSLGGSSKPYFSDSIAIASFGAVQNGVFVSCSAGNSGPSRSSISNAAPWIMTVAASYQDRSFPTTVKLGNGQTFTGASLYHGNATASLPLVYNKTAGSGQGAEYCLSGSLDSRLVKGKIVLCQRGMNGRPQKGEIVKLAGGAGMLLVNTDEQGEELFADAHILPATSLGALAGAAVKKYVNVVKNPRASIQFQGTVYGNPAPVMAAFSSRGPSSVGPDVIKPDITAPGVNILAAWPPEVSPTQLSSDKRSVLFNIISGTSMSCPHVSGLAALLKSAHRDWSPAAIKSAMMTTAYTVDSKRAPIADVSPGTSNLATPFALGSGHVDPERASDPGLVYDITPNDYLNYLCTLNYTSSQVAIVSRGSFTCPDDLIMQPGDLNYPSFAVTFGKNAKNGSLTYKRTVTNVGPAQSTYVVDVIKPDGVSVVVEPRVLYFHNVGEKLSYKVTFIASGGRADLGNFSFGSLVWESGKHTVTSAIAITWLE